MSALAPALQAYFTDRLIGQRAASPNTIAAYKTSLRLLRRLRLRTNRQEPERPGHRRSRRAADRRVLGPPRTRPAQQRRDPQQPPRRDPLAVRLPRPAPPRTRRHHPTSARHPTQTNPTQPRHLPHRTRGRRAARPPATTTSWTGRRDHAMFALTIQTGLRISELAGLNCARRHAHRRRQRAHHRQRPQRTTHTARPHHTHDPQGLARRTRRRTRPTRCSRPPPADASAATPSNAASPTTSPSPPRPAPHCGPNTSPCTHCATPPPCASCSPATTSPSSPSGSATNRSPRRTSTSTPT